MGPSYQSLITNSSRWARAVAAQTSRRLDVPATAYNLREPIAADCRVRVSPLGQGERHRARRRIDPRCIRRCELRAGRGGTYPLGWTVYRAHLSRQALTSRRHSNHPRERWSGRKPGSSDRAAFETSSRGPSFTNSRRVAGEACRCSPSRDRRHRRPRPARGSQAGEGSSCAAARAWAQVAASPTAKTSAIRIRARVLTVSGVLLIVMSFSFPK